MNEDPARTRLAVLGSPIAHSRSPRLHAAAYEVLGLPWTYDRFEVGEGALASFVADLDETWRGLSLTMPLKPEAFALAAEVSDVAAETRAVNTLLLRGDRVSGYNTDVYGITRALREGGVEQVGDVLVLGAGATARSVISAMRRMGASTITIAARRPEAAQDVADFAGMLGLTAAPASLTDAPRATADLVVNTIPGGASAALPVDSPLSDAALLEIAYDPWPSPLVARWSGPVVSGLAMLLHQAVGQVRVFVTGDPHTMLPDEDAVVAAMRRALD